jgi:hypothetical protein
MISNVIVPRHHASEDGSIEIIPQRQTCIADSSSA